MEAKKKATSKKPASAKPTQQVEKTNPIIDWMDYIGHHDSSIKIYAVLPVMILCLKSPELTEKLLSSAKKWMEDIISDSKLDTDLTASDALFLGEVYGMMKGKGTGFTLDNAKQISKLLVA
jgi:hypothetical protein